MHKRPERGGVSELVVAIIALAVAVTALVVALTRDTRGSKTAAPATSTTLPAPQVARPGTVSVSRSGVTTLQVIGLVRIPIDHVGHYSWTGPRVTVPRGALQANGAYESLAAGWRVEGVANLQRGIQVLPVTDLRHTKRAAFRVTFNVTSFSGKPDVLVTGATIHS